MPSVALQTWRTSARRALDEIEAAHAAVGGTGPGRRYATQQINQAYAVLSSQFQRFCRDLHTEAVDHFVTHVAVGVPVPLYNITHQRFIEGRKLSSGNPNPANLGSDFTRIGMALWPALLALTPANSRRRISLEELNRWRNAIAHQDFASVQSGGTPQLQVRQVRVWRSTCDGLAVSMDRAVRRHLLSMTGAPPW